MSVMSEDNQQNFINEVLEAFENGNMSYTMCADVLEAEMIHPSKWMGRLQNLMAVMHKENTAPANTPKKLSKLAYDIPRKKNMMEVRMDLHAQKISPEEAEQRFKELNIPVYLWINDVQQEKKRQEMISKLIEESTKGATNSPPDPAQENNSQVQIVENKRRKFKFDD